MKTLSSVLLLALCGSMGVLAACGGKDACETMYDKEIQCDPDKKDMPKALFVAACQAAKNDPEEKEEFADKLECSKKATCQEVEACEDGKRGKKRAAEISKDLADGKVKDAFSTCSYSPEYYADPTFKAACVSVFAAALKLKGEEASDAMMGCRVSEETKTKVPEFAKACTDMASAALVEATAAATKARDEGKNDYSTCSNLERLAEQAGVEALTKAKALCMEVEVSETAKKAITEAKANVGANKADMPWECGKAVDELAKITSEWATKTSAEVVKACYVDLGVVIINVESKDAKYVCPFRIDDLRKKVAELKLEEQPELKAALATLPATCTAAK